MFRRGVLDIETNGLLDGVTQFHCAVIFDLDSDYYETYTDPELLMVDLKMMPLIVGHNIFQYDLMVLKKLYGFTLPYEIKVEDTLIMSRLDHPDRPGGHSLGAWAQAFGHKKVQNEQWDHFTQHMMDRCIEDTRITRDLYLFLNENHSYSDEAIELEFKVAEIIGRQELTGVNFDKKKADNLVVYLDGLIDEADNKILELAPLNIKSIGTTVTKPYKIDGELTARAIKYNTTGAIIRGSFDPINVTPLSQSSVKQMKDWFLSIGWEPDVWNYKDGAKTSPKLEGESLERIPNGVGEVYTTRVTQAHRRSQIEGWIKRLRDDGRITAGANTIGTNTNRFRHNGVVNVPKAADYIFLGKEMRSLFTANKGEVLVGHDASQLELRLFAAFVNDPEYTKQVLEGDIHTYNQNLAGLATRDEAKTFIYAFLYGAGDAKIGSIVGGGAKEGKKVKKLFMDNLPGFGQLVRRLKKDAKRGYLDGIDGRKIWMRKDDTGRVMDHKVLNTYVQSAGAVVMKRSMVIMNEGVKYYGLPVTKVLDMHDEAQASVPADEAEHYGRMAVQSIRDAGTYYNLACPLDGEYKIGNNWAETH